MLRPTNVARRCALYVLLAAGFTACGGSTALSEADLAAAGSRSTSAASAGAASEAPAESAGVNGASTGNASASAGAGAGASGTDGAAPLVCPPGLPSAAEIAATPRADENLELLALRLSGRIVADAATYSRVVRDVSAVRAQDQLVSAIRYFPRNDGKRILLTADEPTYAAMRAGRYSGWDCLNRTYVVTDTVFNDAKPPFKPFVALTLKGNYDISTVATQYGELAGVQAAEGGVGGGDGPTICVTRESDVWHYVFDQAGGDCPAGCTEHTYHHFTTTATGAVTNYGQIPATSNSKYISPEACR